MRTQAPTTQGPWARSVAAISLLDYFRATGAHAGEPETELFSQHYCYTGLSVAPGRIQQSEHRALGSPPQPSACVCKAYLWVVGAQLIDCTELDQLLVDAERRTAEGTEQALVPCLVWQQILRDQNCLVSGLRRTL